MRSGLPPSHGDIGRRSVTPRPVSPPSVADADPLHERSTDQVEGAGASGSPHDAMGPPRAESREIIDGRETGHSNGRSLRMPSTRSRFVARLGRNLQRRCGVASGSPLIVAVSGGADSMALLTSLAALARRPHLRFRLQAVTIDHALRPEAADEVRVVEEVCRGLSVPLVICRIRPAERSGNLAANARADRYGKLEQRRQALDAASAVVVTAHHGDDQVECVLAALLRGTGPAGLAGMPWRGEIPTAEGPCVVARPMLDLTHADAVAFCREHGVPWVEDATNQRPETLRGHLRTRVLPSLRELAPDFDRRVWRLTAASADIDAIITDLGDRLRHTACRGTDTGLVVFDRVALAGARPTICGTALRQTALELGVPADRLGFELVEQVVEAVRDHLRHPRRFEWPVGIRVEVSSDAVCLVREAEHFASGGLWDGSR